MKILALNCNPDLSYFSNRGLNFEVEHKTITDIFPLQHTHNALNQNGTVTAFYTPYPVPYLEANYKSFDYSIILIGWNPKDYSTLANGTGGYTGSDPLSSGTFWCTVRQDTPPQNNYPIHEIHHALVGILNVNLHYNHSLATQVRDYMDLDSQNRPYYLNEQPENPLSNYAQTWANIKPHLSELLAIKYTTMPTTYKYFKPEEVTGLKPEFVTLLDQARGIAGVPFIITSGYRDPQHNTEVGGVDGSMHEKGLAVDLQIKDTVSGGKILLALIKVGLSRFGFYRDGHIHVDMAQNDPLRPSPCYWVK